MTPEEGGEVIAAALRTVAGIRLFEGLGQPVVPPAVVVGPPRLEWVGYCAQGPSSGRWVVYLVTSLTRFATAELLVWIPPVTRALDEHTPGTVTVATPGLYPAADQGDLPAYQIEIEMELG